MSAEHAARAEGLRRACLGLVFQGFDLDGNGAIQAEELYQVPRHVCGPVGHDL